jgi:hypothetical protein
MPYLHAPAEPGGGNRPDGDLADALRDTMGPSQTGRSTGGHELSAQDTTKPDSGGDRLSALIGPTNDLADEQPRSRIDRILQWVPRVLSSKPHVLVLMALGIYLIVLPILGVTVGASAELIGGNYTNVTSDIGACIAAGGTLHLVGQSRSRRRMDEERLRLAQETHRLLHYVYSDAARQLGHSAPGGGGQPGPSADAT